MTLPRDSQGWSIMPKHGPELTIYVSMDGDDINSGSHIRPKRTIAAALSVVRGGNADAILLRRGDTWHEGVVLDRAGTPDLPVLFGAYGDESLPRPILHEIPDDARTRIAILAPYQIIADIDLVGAGGDNALGMSAGVHHVHVEGCRMANWGMGWRINGEVANPCHHVTMRRCVVVDPPVVDPPVTDLDQHLIDTFRLWHAAEHATD